MDETKESELRLALKKMEERLSRIRFKEKFRHMTSAEIVHSIRKAS